MEIRSQVGRVLSVICSMGMVVSAAAAQGDVTVQKTMVTRLELEATLAGIDRDVNSTGYTQALRDARKGEADAVRARLANGDIQSGDKIQLSVVGFPTFSKEYLVTADRTIILSGGTEISVAGPLRSELSAHLAKQLSKYVEDPIVTATTSIRITLSGALSRNGYFYVPATTLLQGVLMEPGGGPSRTHEPKKDQIKRLDKVILDGPEFASALYDGKTLDQLNVQAGDEIIVAEKKTGNIFTSALGILGAIGAAASGYYFLSQIF